MGVKFLSHAMQISFSSNLLIQRWPLLWEGIAGIDWIVHLDTDESLHLAGAHEYSLSQLLSDVPNNVALLVLRNYFVKTAAGVQNHLCPNGPWRWHNYVKLQAQLYFGTILHCEIKLEGAIHRLSSQT